MTSHPLLGSVLAEGKGAAAVAVQAQLGRPALSFLWDHTVQGRTILPGSAMCEMAVAAGKVCTSPRSAFHMKEVQESFCSFIGAVASQGDAAWNFVDTGQSEDQGQVRTIAGAVRHGDSGM